MASLPHGVPQYLTDTSDNHFHRVGSDSAWVPMPPRKPILNLPPLHDILDKENVFRFPPLSNPADATHYGNFLLPTQDILPALPPLADTTRYGNHSPPVRQILPTLPPPPSIEPLSDTVNVPPALRRKTVQPTMKVAGARRPAIGGKGKGNQVPDKPDKPRGLKRQGAYDIVPTSVKKPRGRATGSSNYSVEDIDALLDILEELVPTGETGWNTVAIKFRDWALMHGRPERNASSLDKKFKQLVRMEKPTGRADCPAYIDRAHAIYDMMDEKFLTHTVDDDDDELVEISDDSDHDDTTYDKILGGKHEGVAVVKQEPGVTVSRRSQTATLARPGKNVGNEFLKTISSALDPRVHAAMTEERTTRSIQNTQILSLTNQLRDSQATIEVLRTRISDVERDRNEVTRKLDRAEMMAYIRDARPAHERRLRRQDISYGDGGQATIWVGSDESDHAGDSPTTKRVTRDFTPEKTAAE